MRFFYGLPLLVLCGGCFGMLQADGNQRADKVGNTVVGQSMARAKDGVCMQNLSQIRQAIMVSRSNGEEGFPASLQELKLPAEMLVDPIGKEPYSYDPETGVVKCEHPGHKKY